MAYFSPVKCPETTGRHPLPHTGGPHTPIRSAYFYKMPQERSCPLCTIAGRWHVTANQTCMFIHLSLCILMGTSIQTSTRGSGFPLIILPPSIPIQSKDAIIYILKGERSVFNALNFTRACHRSSNSCSSVRLEGA